MRFACLFLLFVSLGWAEKKPVTKLQIGVKKRIPAEDCPIKTRNGDNLHMVSTRIEKPWNIVVVFSTTLALCMRMAASLIAASQGGKTDLSLFVVSIGTPLASEIKIHLKYSRGQPLTFQLGTGRVIKGWDQGLVS